MQQITELIKNWFERHACGGCEWCGEKLNVPCANIRKFLICASCLTVGSPIILYMIMGFLKNLRVMIAEQKRGSVWDL